MSEGNAVIGAQALLMLAAWFWRGGNDRLVYWLAAGFVASVWLSYNLGGAERHVAMAFVDAAIVTAASKAWISHHDMRGWLIGGIGLLKIGARLSFMAGDPTNNSHISYWVFAAAMNAAFVAQVIVAGGFADELGKRIADRIRSAGPRRARLLRNVAGR